MLYTINKISFFLKSELYRNLKTNRTGLIIIHDIIKKIINYGQFSFTNNCGDILYDPNNIHSDASTFEIVELDEVLHINFLVHEAEYKELFGLMEYGANLAFEEKKCDDEIREAFSYFGKDVLEKYGTESKNEIILRTESVRKFIEKISDI